MSTLQVIKFTWNLNKKIYSKTEKLKHKKPEFQPFSTISKTTFTNEFVNYSFTNLSATICIQKNTYYLFIENIKLTRKYEERIRDGDLNNKWCDLAQISTIFDPNHTTSRS